MAIQSDYWTTKFVKEDVLVEIRIYLDQIQIFNFPGPEYYIDMEKFTTGKVRTAILKLGSFSRRLTCPKRNQRVFQKSFVS